MNPKFRDVIILYDDPKFFYIVLTAYRFKNKYISDWIYLNYFVGSEDEPESDINKMEYMCYSSASNGIGWVDFLPRKNVMRLARPEEIKLIMTLVGDEIFDEYTEKIK